MTTADRDRAFNEGSDARISGLSVHDNPYPGGTLRVMWKEGWWDVQRNYGAWARGPVKTLPAVTP